MKEEREPTARDHGIGRIYTSDEREAATKRGAASRS